MLSLRRHVDWLFLVNNGGVLVASVGRGKAPEVDPDLMMGMLTAIMNFAKDSFSGERPAELDYFSLGDRKVELVQDAHAYLAAVYTGPRGALERNLQGLLRHIEVRYPKALDDVVDQDSFVEIPNLLKRFMDRGWPGRPFPKDRASPTP